MKIRNGVWAGILAAVAMHAACAPAHDARHGSNTIVGTASEDTQNEFPYMVQIEMLYNTSTLGTGANAAFGTRCMGVLVRANMIVTAGRCLTAPTTPPFTGANNDAFRVTVRDPANRFLTKSVVVPRTQTQVRDFTQQDLTATGRNQSHHDIGLIKLTQSQKIELPRYPTLASAPVADGAPLTSFGRVLNLMGEIASRDAWLTATGTNVRVRARARMQLPTEFFGYPAIGELDDVGGARLVIDRGDAMLVGVYTGNQVVETRAATRTAAPTDGTTAPPPAATTTCNTAAYDRFTRIDLSKAWIEEQIAEWDNRAVRDGWNPYAPPEGEAHFEHCSFADAPDGTTVASCEAEGEDCEGLCNEGFCTVCPAGGPDDTFGVPPTEEPTGGWGGEPEPGWPTCGDSLCDDWAGEDCMTCDWDCGACASGGGETPPGDDYGYGGGDACGNGICDDSPWEDCTICELDCGTC